MKRLNTAMIILGMLAAIVCLATSPVCSFEELELTRKTEAFLKAGDYRRALQLINEFIQEHPEKPIGRALLTKVFAVSGQTDRALKEHHRFYRMSETLSVELLLEILRGALNSQGMATLSGKVVRVFAAEALGNLEDKKSCAHLNQCAQ